MQKETMLKLLEKLQHTIENDMCNAYYEVSSEEKMALREAVELLKNEVTE